MPLAGTVRPSELPDFTVRNFGRGRQSRRPLQNGSKGSAANRRFSERSAPANGMRISAAVSIGCYSLSINADRLKVREFRRVSAISRPNGLFFHIFSAITEKIWPAERRYAASEYTALSVHTDAKQNGLPEAAYDKRETSLPPFSLFNLPSRTAQGPDCA